MDLKRWTHIVALADKRSFVRAAEQVFLSQPALTRSIQAAEEELGLLLFDRGTQAVTPTPAGEFVIARARQLVFNSRCLERDVELYRNRALGDVAFGVGPFPAATAMPSLLAMLRRDYPGINLRVEVSNWQLLLKRLREEDIEFFCADTRDLPHDPSLEIRQMVREPGGIYVRSGHPLAERSVTLKEVWACGLMTVRLPNELRALLAGLLGLPPGGDPALALECDDVHTLKSVVLGCDSAMAGPHAAVAAEVAAGLLRQVSVVDLPPMASRMGVVTLRGRTPSPMAEIVISHLPMDGTATMASSRNLSAED